MLKTCFLHTQLILTILHLHHYIFTQYKSQISTEYIADIIYEYQCFFTDLTSATSVYTISEGDTFRQTLVNNSISHYIRITATYLTSNTFPLRLFQPHTGNTSNAVYILGHLNKYCCSGLVPRRRIKRHMTTGMSASFAD